MATAIVSVDEIKGRRKRRFVAVGIVVAVFLAGNAADFLGLFQWGPGLNNSNDRVWVLASAAGFWVAVSMFLLCCRDLLSILRHRSRPPTLDDLERARVMAGSLEAAEVGSGVWRILVTRFEAIWSGAGRWVEKHLALVGLLGFIVGALVGHFWWRVGTY